MTTWTNQSDQSLRYTEIEKDLYVDSGYVESGYVDTFARIEDQVTEWQSL